MFSLLLSGRCPPTLTTSSNQTFHHHPIRNNTDKLVALSIPFLPLLQLKVKARLIYPEILAIHDKDLTYTPLLHCIIFRTKVFHWIIIKIHIITIQCCLKTPPDTINITINHQYIIRMLAIIMSHRHPFPHIMLTIVIMETITNMKGI